MSQLWPDVVALCACAAAIITDQRSRRIPNWLTGLTAVVGLALHVALACSLARPFFYLAIVLAGGFAAFLLFVVLSLIGFVGYGDTKLMGALGLCVGLPLVPRLIVCTFLAGGVLALVQAARQGKTREVLGNLRPGALPLERVDEAPRRLNLLPYAIAIAIGCAWAILGRYVPRIAPI